MNRNFFKITNPRFSLCFIVLLGVIIIHSCKKDNKTTGPALPPAVAEAKLWYESTYPVATTANTSKLSTQSAGNAANPLVDLSQALKPDWTRAATYKRLGANVVELPLSSASVPKVFSINKGLPVSRIKNSRSSFLLLNDSTGYHAYVMTLIADSSYLKNDPGKLDHDKYNKRDSDFSGTLIYSTPKGKFVSAWIYKNGILVAGTASGGNVSQATQGVNNASSKKLAQASSDEDCYDVYWDTISNGEVTNEEYLYTICIGGAGSGGNGGTGSAPPTGSSSGGGNTTAPPPCPPSTPSVESVNSHLHTDVVQPQPPPAGGGDTGYPPPTTNPSPCAVPVATPPATAPVIDPCAQANAAMANQAFTNRMNYLQSQMNVPGETTDLMMPNGTYQQQVSTVNGGANQTFPPSYFAGSSGFLHNHGKGPGVLSVYSPSDLASLYTIVTQGNVSNPNGYTYGLVNQDGQSYLLTVSDMSKFTAWANSYVSSGQPNSILNSVYNSLVSTSNTDAVNENNFVNLLQSTESGLTLMRGNSTNTAWSQVVKNTDGTYSVIQCPIN